VDPCASHSAGKSDLLGQTGTRFYKTSFQKNYLLVEAASSTDLLPWPNVPSPVLMLHPHNCAQLLSGLPASLLGSMVVGEAHAEALNIGAVPDEIFGFGGLCIELNVINNHLTVSIAYNNTRFMRAAYDLVWDICPQWESLWKAANNLQILRALRPGLAFPAFHATWADITEPSRVIGVAGFGSNKRWLKYAFALSCAIHFAANRLPHNTTVVERWHQDDRIQDTFRWCVDLVRWSNYLFSHLNGSWQVIYLHIVPAISEAPSLPELTPPHPRPSWRSNVLAIQAT
jgi:hypothetical protein